MMTTREIAVECFKQLLSIEPAVPDVTLVDKYCIKLCGELLPYYADKDEVNEICQKVKGKFIEVVEWGISEGLGRCPVPSVLSEEEIDTIESSLAAIDPQAQQLPTAILLQAEVSKLKMQLQMMVNHAHHLTRVMHGPEAQVMQEMYELGQSRVISHLLRHLEKEHDIATRIDSAEYKKALKKVITQLYDLTRNPVK
jgi:hypothetical protein